MLCGDVSAREDSGHGGRMHVELEDCHILLPTAVLLIIEQMATPLMAEFPELAHLS